MNAVNRYEDGYWSISSYLQYTHTHMHTVFEESQDRREEKQRKSKKKKKKILSHFIVQTSRIQQQQEQHNYEYKSLY